MTSTFPASLFKLRAAKAWFALTRPCCWRALRTGVAPSIEHGALLREVQCDLLLDVGANRGQFSLMARLIHPELPIHAYEPLPSEAAMYRQVLGADRRVSLHEFALGAECGTAELHVSGSPDSSSLLPIGHLQAQHFPGTEEVKRTRVPVVTLDTLASHWQSASRALLKLDVQGFELQVLRGARNALHHCGYVYAECSNVALYCRQALFPEVAGFLGSEGFTLIRRLNEYWADDELIQADYLFGRSRG
jgi:FkbM family methyltransferase